MTHEENTIQALYALVCALGQQEYNCLDDPMYWGKSKQKQQK
jgi:hypothetical protein